MSRGTLFQLVDADELRVANFIVDVEYLPGSLPRILRYGPRLFAYQRPLPMHTAAGRPAHQYRACQFVDLTDAPRYERGNPPPAGAVA